MGNDILDIETEEPQSEVKDVSDEIKFLREDLTEALELLVKSEKGKQYFDPKLSDTLKEIFLKTIEKLGNIKPPEVKVNVDLKPVLSIASNIEKQNENVMVLINKMFNGDKSGELYRLIVAMVGKNNAFLEKSMQQFDYTKQLQNISEALNKNTNIEKLTVLYGEHNRIKEVTPIYKK